MPIGGALKQAVFERESLQHLTGADAPERVESLRPVKLTIGIATHDDYDGAFFTIASLRLHHSEVCQDAEIIILDNHAGGIESDSLALLARQHNVGANVRYIPFNDVHSTAVREVLFHEAQGEIVVVLDSHVLLAPGALKAVLDFFADPAHARDMAHGPLLTYDAQRITATHMDPGFRAGMYGTWGVDPRGQDPHAAPFEITLSGLGAFAMRKDAWPGLNPLFHGFGGEEGYIHEKVRQAGGQVFCLPAMRWIHRFERPRGVPYVNQWVDRIHNYLLGWREVGMDQTAIDEHFGELLGDSYPRVKGQAEDLITESARQVDGFIVIGDATRVAPWQRTLAALIETNAQWIREPVQEDSPIAAWERGLQRARMRGWRSLVVVDEAAGWDAHGLRDLALRTVGLEVPSPQRTEQGRVTAILVPNQGTDDLDLVDEAVASWMDVDHDAVPENAVPENAVSENAVTAAVSVQTSEQSEAAVVAVEPGQGDPGTVVDQEPSAGGDAWLTSTPRRDLDRVEQTDVPDGVVLYDTQGQVAHHLNPGAMLVWELIDGRSGLEMVEEVVRTLELDRAGAETYVKAALDQFGSLQLLSPPR